MCSNKMNMMMAGSGGGSCGVNGMPNMVMLPDSYPMVPMIAYEFGNGIGASQPNNVMMVGVGSGNGSGSCCPGSYATLQNYSAGLRGIRPPVPLTTVGGYYVVPNYSAPGYDTLTHGKSDCGGCGGDGSDYFRIGKAYGAGAGCCNTQYMGSICQ